MFNHMALEPRCGALRPGALEPDIENREENYKGEGTWLEKNTSHLPSQSIDETSAGNSKIFINECVVYR